MKTPELRFRLSVLAAAVATLMAGGVPPSDLCAQNVAPANTNVAPANTSEEDELIVLSPFVVSTEGDEGYAATSSMMGGRMNTSLAETAASVSVLTDQFLQDLAVTTLTEAAEWAPNTVDVYRDEPNPFNDYTVAIRNLGASYQTSKNYFRYYVNPDAFFTERIDFGRGPNSLVFGDTGVAGAFNVSSKRAGWRPKRRIESQFFDTGGYRFAIDVNQPLTKTFSVRAVLVTQDSDGWHDRERTRFDGASASFTWKPLPKTTVWGEVEYMYRKATYAGGLFDFVSRWDGVTTVSAPLATSPAASTGVSRQTSDRFVYNTARPDLGVINWRNWGYTNGTNIQLAPAGWDAPPDWGLPANARTPLPTVPGFDYSPNFPHSNYDNRLRGVTFAVEHQFTPQIFGEIALNKVWSETANNRLVFRTRNLYRDINQFLPSGAANPYFNQLFVENYDDPEAQFRNPEEGRVSLAYVDNFPLVDLRAMVGFNFRNDYFDVFRLTRAYTGGTNPDLTNAANRIWWRRYLTEFDAPFMMPESSRIFKNSGSTRTDKFHRSWQGAVVAKWFQDRRLLTSVGYRFEAMKNKRSSPVVDPVSKVMTGWGDYNLVLDDSMDNVNLNAIYRLTEWVSIYGAYAESFEYTGAATFIDGSDLPMIGAEGYEGGLRFKFFEGKVHATAVYYQNDRINQRVSGSSGDINPIWDDLELATGQDFTDERVREGYSDTQSWRGTGFELDIMANPTRNWRLMANFSLPKSKQVDGYAATKAYFADKLPFWQSQLASLDAAAHALEISRINQNISDIQGRISGFAEGRELNNNYKYTANLFANYTFTGGRLDGFSVGAGANLRGKRIAGNLPNLPYDYVWGEGYINTSLRVGYGFKWRDGTVRIQLNVKNVFDDPQPATANNFYSSVTYTDTSGATPVVFVPRAYTVVAPRSATLTMSYDF